MSYPALRSDAPPRLPVTGLRVHSSPTGELFELSASSRTAPDGNFRFVWTLAPGKVGPEEHVHEEETETFEIVSGTIRIWIEGVARDYAAGDQVVIPPRTGHRFLNPGPEPVVINVALSGPRMEDLLAPLAVETRGRGMKVRDMLLLMAAFDAHRPSTPVRTFDRWVMGAITALLRWVGPRPLPTVAGWDTMETASAR